MPVNFILCMIFFTRVNYLMNTMLADGQYLVKIRLNFKEWQDSYSFMTLLREEQHYDALFIFSKLLAENAFHFCAMPREYGLEKSMRKYLERGVTGTVDEDMPSVSEVLLLEETGILSSLDELSKKYYKVKCGLNSASKQDKPHELLNYASPTIADDIRKILTVVSGSSSDRKDEGDAEKSIGSHRKKLKDKCYGAGPSKDT